MALRNIYNNNIATALYKQLGEREKRGRGRDFGARIHGAAGVRGGRKKGGTSKGRRKERTDGQTDRRTNQRARKWNLGRVDLPLGTRALGFWNNNLYIIKYNIY